MGVDRSMLDQLETRFDFSSWRESNALSENLFVWHLYLTGSELPGWQATRIEVLTFEGWPPSIQSIWTRESGETEAVLRLDVFQCGSAVAAKEFLLRTLGEFQSPLLARRNDVGDVAFSMGDTNIAYARGNVVVMLRNAGAQVVSVMEPARALDTDLSTRAETHREQVEPSITRLEVVRDASGQDFRLEVVADDPLGHPVWFKLFARGGEIYAEGDELRYRPGSGSQSITAYAINPNGGLAVREIEVGGETVG